jgi:hypothetical protein
MSRPRAPTWIAAASAAFIGWLFVVLLAVLDVPFGWALLGGTVMAGAFAGLFARKRAVNAIAALGFTPACILLGWPILALVSVYVRYWITGDGIGE